MKRFCFYLVFWTGFLIVFFLVGEVCFRVFRGNPNPLSKTTQRSAKYLFKPDSRNDAKSSIEGEFAYAARINRFGYRGKDFTDPKLPGRLRIFAVGDSFTYGVGAGDDETIPARIEQALKKQGLDVEVVNAGIGHASPVTHYVNLRDIHLKYQPDLVVLLFDLTDLWDDWHSERSAVKDKNGKILRFDPTSIYGKKDWWRTCCLYSAFCKYINNKIVRSFKKIRLIGFGTYMKLALQGKRAKAEIINSDQVESRDAKIEYDGLLMLRGREKKELIDQNWPRTAKYLTKIRDLLAEHKIPMILVMYPHGIYVGKDQWNDGREPWGFEKNKLYTDLYPFELVEKYARDNGIPFINTLDHFFEVKPQKFFYSYDGHMTPAGYRTVAEGIVQDEAFQEAVSSLASKK